MTILENGKMHKSMIYDKQANQSFVESMLQEIEYDYVVVGKNMIEREPHAGIIGSIACLFSECTHVVRYKIIDQNTLSFGYDGMSTYNRCKE
ncbi:hypothetical protein [Candidatus Venteria ishoeyi]|uniref:Uncharacterized protein n=1 Tax=Candidatus Venteria ishoeyi TaxID=1899563 RepID=A0A1H6FA69_9GAMM|nr:hypothetical protein [Candidatus Venteria ishoeyi]SEH06261.1 Uncharacterised protein [Candidatus Venteria ishoeyi]